MGVFVSLYSNKEKEINRFLTSYYGKEFNVENNLKWDYCFQNPTESADLIGVYSDNKDKFKINMWISFDQNFFLNVTDYNVDKIIRYLYERYPY